MKVITTNLLNRFWKNGVKPIKDDVAKKLNTSNIINNLLATASGYALDARQGKVLDEKITELNGKLSETGAMVKIASTTSTSYQAFTVNTALYRSYVLMVTRSGIPEVPIASTTIPGAIISNISSDGSNVRAEFAEEVSNYSARCYFSGTTVYLKSKSQYDCAVLYGVK